MKVLQIKINQSLKTSINIDNIEIIEIVINFREAIPVTKKVKINDSDILWLDIIDKNITKSEIRKIQNNLNDLFPENQIIFIQKNLKLRLNPQGTN